MILTIRTANHTERCHTLTPYKTNGETYCFQYGGFQVETKLRVCYGDEDPYKFTHYLSDHTMGETLEIVTRDELERRCEQALDNGDSYDGSAVAAFRSDSNHIRSCQAIEAHFRAMMTLNLFQLSATI